MESSGSRNYQSSAQGDRASVSVSKRSNAGRSAKSSTKKSEPRPH